MRPVTVDRLRDTALPWLLPAAILLGWQGAVSAGLVSNRFMPAPLDVVRGRLGGPERTGGTLDPISGSATPAGLAGFVVGGGIGFALWASPTACRASSGAAHRHLGADGAQRAPTCR